MVCIAGIALASDLGAEWDVDRWVDSLPQALQLFAPRRSRPLPRVSFARVVKGRFGGSSVRAFEGATARAPDCCFVNFLNVAFPDLGADVNEVVQ